jgi:putative flavoprotein involved in K+ transport
VVHGHLGAVDGGVARFAPDLADLVADADANADRFRASVDRWVAAHGVDAPADAARPPRDTTWAHDAAPTLDLRAAGITSVVWATGFRRDFSWVHAPVFDAAGEPVHRRGVTAADGLVFLGLKWLHRRSSSFLDGVGADAEYLADHLALRRAEAAGGVLHPVAA